VKQVHFIATFVVLLGCSLFLVSLIWLCLVHERVYHCWDRIIDPISFPQLVSHPQFAIGAIFAFIPPFAHHVEGDHYVWPEWTVYLLWLGLVAVALGGAWFGTKFMFRYFHQDRS
jgi:hypothetical protein